MSISVALAAKDGERYLQSQVESILPQLSEARGDELIISTDPSSDATAEIVASLARQAPVIRQLTGPGRGVQANFEHALRACTGSHLFLSDQDDVWMPDKVTEVMDAFDASDAALILHDAAMVDEDLYELAPSYFARRGSRAGLWPNILRNSYVGCCLAFRRELLDYALPFPPDIPMHDQWLGLVASRFMTVHLLPVQLVRYRRHRSTATSDTQHARLWQMTAWRYAVIRALRKRERELR
ncbi:MAG: glycosyltransferase [Coriobacteriales bacterium]|jgi:glycosyltransferase involved in cell wall biosynthesis|nr:glycosyltransferase [Coriobacteriales bacterium]